MIELANRDWIKRLCFLTFMLNSIFFLARFSAKTEQDVGEILDTSLNWSGGELSWELPGFHELFQLIVSYEAYAFWLFCIIFKLFIHKNVIVNLNLSISTYKLIYISMFYYFTFSAIISDHKNGRQFNHVFVKFCNKFMIAANANDNNQTSRLVDITIRSCKRLSRH